MGSYLNIQHFKCALQFLVLFGTLLNPTNALTDRGVVQAAKHRTDLAEREATVLPSKPDRDVSSFGPIDGFTDSERSP